MSSSIDGTNPPGYNGTKRRWPQIMVPIRSKQIDHRIRLNDEELALICQGLKALSFEQRTPEEHKKWRLFYRLSALGCFRR